MRWKLIRRRLSVSAPKMIVRSHLPWPVRWAVVALMLGFSAAIGLWAFELGKDIAGLGRDVETELSQLRGAATTLRKERDEAQSLANAADSLIRTERATQERLAQDLRQLEARNLALEADLGFFQRLLPAGNQPLQLRALQAEVASAGQLRYQMLVMQGGKNVSEFSGRYDIVMTGTQSGQPWSGTHPGGPQPLKLRQYARVEGQIEFPAEVVLKAVQARVLNAENAVKASGIVKLP